MWNLILLLRNTVSSCVDKITCSSGSQLYQMSREELREMCGVSDGIRLFSHLQKDKSKVRMFRQVQVCISGNVGVIVRRLFCLTSVVYHSSIDDLDVLWGTADQRPYNARTGRLWCCYNYAPQVQSNWH